MKNEMVNRKIIFFDGVCHLCNRFVDSLIHQDAKRTVRRFYFAPLQGETAQVLSISDRQSLGSVVYFDQGRIYRRSDAILQIFADLGGVYIFLTIFRIVPRIFRDAVYNWIARHRYAWFGEREFCRLPEAHEREYLLP